jgi:hypothetical protein
MTQDGAGDSSLGFSPAAPLGEAAVALAEEGIGPGSGRGDLAQRAVQPRVALARRLGGALLAGLTGLRTPLCPGDQPAGGAEDAHIEAYLGDDGLGGDDAAAGDLILRAAGVPGGRPQPPPSGGS